MKFPRCVLSLATLVLVVALAPAAVDSVAPLSVAEGMTIAVTGSGFGKSPTATLVNGGTRIATKRQKKPKATDTAFSALVKKAPAGTYTLEVKPKGAASPFTFPGVTVELPRVDLVEPASAAPGDVVKVSGAFFGKSKGFVTVGCRQTKLKKWDKKLGTATFVVPSGLPAGPQDVTVTGGAGQGLPKIGALTITAASGNGESVVGTFGGKCFAADQVNIRAQDGFDGPLRLLTVSQAVHAVFKLTESVFVQVRVPADATFPITVEGSVSFSVLTDGQFTENYRTQGNVSSVTITSVAGGFLEGTFDVSMIPNAGVGTLGNPISAQGSFRAEFIP